MLNAARFSREHIKRIPVMKLFSRWIHTSRDTGKNSSREKNEESERKKKSWNLLDSGVWLAIDDFSPIFTDKKYTMNLSAQNWLLRMK